jgi:LysM repeat protein
VKEGETMKLIASNLDMKTRDLLRLNPDVGRNPEANTVIVVPNKKMAKTTTKVINTPVVVDDVIKEEVEEQIKVKDSVNNYLEDLKKQFILHEVKPKETIYGLKRFYNISEEDLFTLNPELSEGLKIGQFIKIKTIEEGGVIENLRYEDFIKPGISLKVALMLPFKTKNYDSIDSKDIFEKSKLANIVTDFYLGVEIAIDSLQKQGINVALNVIDTQDKKSKISTIITENNLNVNDVIIGPLYSEEAVIVANSVKIPVVYPVYSADQANFTSPKIIKTSPEKKIFREELVTYIKDNFNNGNLIVVGDGKQDSNIKSNLIVKSLQMHDSISKVHFFKPEKGYIKKERFLEVLKPNTKNWVILTTNDDAMVDGAINSLISLPDSTSVKIFTADKGAAFNKIANIKLAKVNFTYVSDEYVNEATNTTQTFNNQYFKKNNALPSFYATKGFDITYDVLIRLASGKNLKETFKNGASFRVESKFDYTNKPLGVSENKGLFIVQYNDDLTLTRLK